MINKTKTVQEATNKIIAFRNLALADGYESLFDHGSVNDKRMKSNYITLCLIVDELCDALEAEVNHV